MFNYILSLIRGNKIEERNIFLLNHKLYNSMDNHKERLMHETN